MWGRLLWWLSGRESTCQCRRHGFDPWSRKIPHAAEQLGPGTTTIEPGPQTLGATTTESLATTTSLAVTTAACVLQSPCSATREAAAISPRTITREQSLITATRESPHSNEDPVQPKINKSNYFLSSLLVSTKSGKHDLSYENKVEK